MEVLFYHLQRQPLEQVLPKLLEVTLSRGWRAIVQTGSEERAAALNAHLWNFRDDAFLPHGNAADGDADMQPIYLTHTPENPNGANVLFLVDGAAVEGVDGYDRTVLMYDGGDEMAVDAARRDWKQVKDAGFDCTYWQQTPEGRWENKA